MSDGLSAQGHYDDIATALSEAIAGTRVEGRLHIGEMASGAAIAIPFVIIKGARPGKTFWNNGQVHGNEITGIVAALDFVNGLDATAMVGTVIVTATANPLGLDDRNFIVPQDVSNLDTVFPGDPAGFVSGRMANRLIEAMQAVGPDLTISMHSQNTFTASRTHGVYKIPPGSTVSKQVMNLHGHVVERPSFGHDVVVIAIRVDPVVHTGDRLAYLGHEWDEITV